MMLDHKTIAAIANQSEDPARRAARQIEHVSRRMCVSGQASIESDSGFRTE
jgi:hypothetical protein